MSVNLSESSCYHCGLNLPDKANDIYILKLNSVNRSFCCPGCRAIAQMIHDSGMENYYQYRTTPGQLPDFQGSNISNDLQLELELYDNSELQQDFVNELDNGNLETTLSIEGITCAACVW